MKILKRREKHGLTVSTSLETPKKNKFTLPYVIVRPLKAKYRENLERSQRGGKTHIPYKVTIIRTAMDFSERVGAKRQRNDIIKMIKEKTQPVSPGSFTLYTQ